ncbi:MAG: EF-hand domain-containing protein [Myxococcaceae bacterium]|nr:EF-hand domain-containing protein [Myxococcaceae bacterium]
MRFMNQKNLGFAAACALAFSGVAFANDKDHDAMFKSMDTNGDEKISADEHAQNATQMFEAMDTDKDGKVTLAEMTAFHEKKMGGKKAGKSEMSSTEKFKEIDTNGDGFLTATEHSDGAKLMFTRMDTDKDGYLSKAEFNDGHKKLMKKKTS